MVILRWIGQVVCRKMAFKKLHTDTDEINACECRANQ
jgi:hypothetical protein